MREQQISSGYTITRQWISIFPMSLFFVYIIYFMITTNFSFERCFFLIIILLILTMFAYRELIFADIYKVSDQIIIRKITGNRKRLISDIASIDEGVFANNFYIKFNDGQKVYFKLKGDDFLKRYTSFTSEDILKDIWNKLK